MDGLAYFAVAALIIGFIGYFIGSGKMAAGPLTIGIIVVLIALPFLLNLFIWLYAGSTPETYVPNVLGMSGEKAISVLKASDLDGEVTGVSFSREPGGTVISQRPEGGKKVKVQRKISLIVSAAEVSVMVPSLLAKTTAEAQSILDGAGLKVGQITEQISEAPEGTIVSQTPVAGDSVSKGTEDLFHYIRQERRRMIKVAPSILSADFSVLGKELSMIEKAGADLVHIDVMDGHFVPNLTMGPLVVKAAKKASKLPLDVHLMIEDPMKYIKVFAEAGSDLISFHAEVCKDPLSVVAEIEKYGKQPALAVNPDSKYVISDALLKKLKMVLFMTVFPGFEGQKFIAEVMPNITALKERIDALGLDTDIEVDGGINPETAKIAKISGANVLVAGSAVFYSKDYKEAIDKIRNA